MFYGGLYSRDRKCFVDRNEHRKCSVWMKPNRLCTLQPQATLEALGDLAEDTKKNNERKDLDFVTCASEGTDCEAFSQ